MTHPAVERVDNRYEIRERPDVLTWLTKVLS
jgi:hypothetical protein